MISFNLILPELNDFITAMGGAHQKGLIITLFTISAAISRPFSGKLADTIGRKKVIILGVIMAFIVTILYPLFSVVAIFLMFRFLHGFSAGFMPTGATALVTDILPEKRRGQGMGIWGVFISVGMGIGQGLGSIIESEFGMTTLFYTSALTAVAALIMILFLKETLPNPVKFKWSLLKISWKDVFDPHVLPAAIVMFLSAAASGLALMITPDISGYLHIENKGWFFIFYVFSTIFVRLFASSVSDNIGRRKTLLFGVFLIVVSMIMVATANSIFYYTAAAIVFGLATGVTSPTIFAWMADLSHPERRGIGAGTLFIALELGIMAGAASSLLTYNNTFESIKYAFIPVITMSVLAILYLFWHLKYRQSVT